MTDLLKSTPEIEQARSVISGNEKRLDPKEQGVPSAPENLEAEVAAEVGIDDGNTEASEQSVESAPAPIKETEAKVPVTEDPVVSEDSDGGDARKRKILGGVLAHKGFGEDIDGPYGLNDLLVKQEDKDNK